ncbi:unnamed protein product [Hermetia illucens]|uniref:non-specific serine/threonine protein kinase n=1 Tax=Hermetia illucens TaxID=343691 RepID=A0A7R8V3E0_HERIL|nr:serine/threonine-protein kinase pelle [Hermetia illucens]CAD7092126.1 unnamed protein product [Hermetia illucens]
MSSAGNSTTRTSSEPIKDMYLYEIPSPERHALCTILDEMDVWADLAVNHMGYRKEDLQSIRRAIQLGASPTDELLAMWGNLNHTITELFILLYRMQQYGAMDAIRNLVDKKYHRLIMSGQPDLSKLIANSNGSKKILNCPSSQMLSDSNNLSTTTSISDESSKITSKSMDMRDARHYASTIPRIDYAELAVATMDWNDRNILGKGGFGTVFKGMWKLTEVAIKRIEYRGTGTREAHKIQVQQSLNELKHLNSCRHDNILPLYGYSINGDEPCLVYQFMAGGSLEQRLTSKKFVPLNCQQRLNIAQGTARGLQYLHTFREKPLIHGDIKPANILLDPCNQPKIGDFGLAREGPNALNSSMEVSRVYGTKPYLPGEFLGYKSLSTKVDTYSFGVVLLELVTGLRAYDKNREHKFLTKHMMAMPNSTAETLIDRNLIVDPETEKICQRIIVIGKRCISDRPEHRPEMSEVYNDLLAE